MTDYFYKYQKYKQKYLDLTNQINQTGGKRDYPIIHISGPSGAGKTTLGNKLIYKFGKNIVVKDIDDLRYDFIKKEYGGFNKINAWKPEKYQEYIDNFVKKNKQKPIVFVGLNHMPWWNKRLYYDMHPTHKFYIKLNSDLIFKQKCSRFLEDVFVEHRENTLKNIIKNEKETHKNLYNAIKGECNYEKTIKMNEIWNTDYKEQGYKFLSREAIFDEVSNILNEYL